MKGGSHAHTDVTTSLTGTVSERRQELGLSYKYQSQWQKWRRKTGKNVWRT